MDDDKQVETPRNLPSKRFVALLYLPLMLPALLPLYFAQDQEDPALVGIMVGMTIMVLIINAVMLVGMYRWFAREE